MVAPSPRIFGGGSYRAPSAAVRKTGPWRAYGPQFGPDITFLGVDRCDWATRPYPDADVVIIGAPFDGGTSYRSGARFGPQYIRQTDYLPHDGSRPSLALRTDGLQDLRVYDAGDVEMFSGDAAGHARPAGRGVRGDPERRPAR